MKNLYFCGESKNIVKLSLSKYLSFSQSLFITTPVTANYLSTLESTYNRVTGTYLFSKSILLNQHFHTYTDKEGLIILIFVVF